MREGGHGAQATRPRGSDRARAAAERRRPAPTAPRRAASRSRARATAIRADISFSASAIGSGRWTQSASGPSGLRPSTRTGWPGLPTTVEFGGTSWITTVLAPIFAPWPIVIGPSSFAPEPIVTLSCDRRVALAGLEAGAAERDALVERHVGAELGRLADHDAHPVVDEQAVADPRRRVDLDPGQRARHVGQRARDDRHVRGVERVRDAVREQRVQAGPAREDLGRRDAASPRGRAARTAATSRRSSPETRRIVLRPSIPSRRLPAAVRAVRAAAAR